MRIPIITKKTKHIAGFTLLELVVVVALLSVLTGLVIPVYNRAMFSLRIRNTTQDITSLIRYAQEKAIAESREFRVLIDEDKGTFRLMRLKSQSIEGDKEFEPVAPADGGEALQLPETMTISRITAGKDRATGLHYISCFPNGASDHGQLVIETNGSRKQRISIKWTGALGRFEIK
ncbi:MAG TPA: GspH/FimT family protein [Candidatus Hydrogenedens sp.]|nr:GspH/FimT family protein [Candidatus Hydrogenedens sp.]HOL18738.1 GspH/FimT family protein [Candidatus Hydrogenedens sp.]HPP59112.1 GspH/FimT family protein [Candidatus Hydrogenedens sp.]